MNMLESLNIVVEYIEENLKNDINLEEMAKKACFSQWYLQRIFMSITDISLSEYIRRRKLTSAAFDLQNKNERIIDVALRYGYQSPDSFTRAFKKLHDVTPSKVRDEGVMLKAFPPIKFVLSIKGVAAMNYKIEKKGKMRIVGERKWVSTVDNQQFKEIPEMWDNFPKEKHDKLISIAKEEHKGLIGICGDMYNNGFEYWIGSFSDSEDIEGFEVLEISECTWAIFEVIGAMRPIPNNMHNIWGRIYSEWLPNSSYKHADVPEIEYYSDGDCMKDDYKSEIWVPVISE